jgi:hypothetical protein
MRFSVSHLMLIANIKFNRNPLILYEKSMPKDAHDLTIRHFFMLFVHTIAYVINTVKA